MLTLLLRGLEHLCGYWCYSGQRMPLKMFTRHDSALILAGSNKLFAIAPKPCRRRNSGRRSSDGISRRSCARTVVRGPHRAVLEQRFVGPTDIEATTQH